MKLEHRLQHAARELREVHIEVPPLGTRRPIPTSRLPMLAAPMLVPAMFVIGALFALGAARDAVPAPASSDIPAVRTSAVPDDSPDAGSSDRPDVAPVSAPSVVNELALITEILDRGRTETRATATVIGPEPRPARDIAPI